MPGIQRYVSKELVHFVGRGLDEEAQYRLLVQILTSGWLTYPPHNPDPAGTFARDMVIEVGGRISNNDLYYPGVVCFCDIPLEDLQIHMKKYSRFGISFLKSCLVKKGANPVLYVAKNSLVPVLHSVRKHDKETIYEYPADAYRAEWNQLLRKTADNPGDEDARRQCNEFWTGLEFIFAKIPRASHFDKMLAEFEDPPSASLPPEVKDLPEVSKKNWFLHEFFIFLRLDVFSFIKFFDDAKPDDDPDNYYMEREWRMASNLDFNLIDVYRIILPQAYADRLRTDLSGYTGQVHYSD